MVSSASQVISFAGTLTVGGVQYPGSTGTFTLGTAPAPPPVTPPAPSSSQCYFGVWDDGSSYPATSWAGVQKFSACPVKSATYYLAWLGPFPATLNSLARQNGATLFLNLEPQNTWGGGANPAVPDIAAGKYDSWLTQVGQAIKAGGNVVRVTWAHEMNGNWYPWGTQAITAAQWIAGWTHVYQVLKAAAGDLCQMVWAPNNNDGGRAVTPYWPGRQFVDVVAFDGYLNTASASQTYASFIAPTVAEIRKLTSQPIWNAETGVLGTNREARITQFVSDMHSAGLSGFTWFNEGSYLLDASELAALCAAVNAWDAA